MIWPKRSRTLRLWWIVQIPMQYLHCWTASLWNVHIDVHHSLSGFCVHTEPLNIHYCERGVRNVYIFFLVLKVLRLRMKRRGDVRRSLHLWCPQIVANGLHLCYDFCFASLMSTDCSKRTCTFARISPSAVIFLYICIIIIFLQVRRYFPCLRNHSHFPPFFFTSE